MGTKLKVRKKSSGATGSSHDLNDDDQLVVIKERFKLSKKETPDYDVLRKEIETEYDISLPEEVDISDLSAMNKLCAIGQAYVSRVTTISMLAIRNYSNWDRVVKRMKSYIESKRSKLLVRDDIAELKSSQQRDAKVRNELETMYNTLDKLEDARQEAEAFMKIVEAKEKDLKLVLTNLNRQVNTLKTDKPF